MTTSSIVSDVTSVPCAHLARSSNRLTFLKAFETDLFPLAVGCHDVDVCVRRNIAAATATDGMLSELIRIITGDEETRLLVLVKLACRVQLDHVIASAISAPQFFFVNDRHSDLCEIPRR